MGNLDENKVTLFYLGIETASTIGKLTSQSDCLQKGFCNLIGREATSTFMVPRPLVYAPLKFLFTLN